MTQRRRTETGSQRSSWRPSVRLRIARTPRWGRYLQSMATETYLLQIVVLLGILWALFCAAFYFAERTAPGTSVTTYGQALYWGIAAFSTAGIADAPKSGLAMLIGGTWIVIGSVIFFGTIVGSVTGYFMRPVQRPVHQIIETIEYNLENLEDLSSAELGLLKQTTDSLLSHMERIRKRSGDADDEAHA